MQIIDSHRNYIDQNKASRALLSMMTKIRATQTLGAALCDKGSHTRAYDLYKKIIREMLADSMQENFRLDQIMKLEEALKNAEGAEKPEDKAWFLRSTIDTVYDLCIGDFNAVESMKPPSLHTQIKDTIRSASTQIDGGNLRNGMEQYAMLLKQIQSNTKYKNSISPAALKQIDISVKEAEATVDARESATMLRSSLDRIYNEIRLPEVYSPCSGPQSAVKGVAKRSEGILMIDFRQADGSLFPYDLQCLNDKVMNGGSDSNIELMQDEKYLRFNGTLSRINRGGFASFRIVPTDKSEMAKVLKDVTGINIEVRNLTKSNKRFKFQLANEAHLKSFNWQSEFIVEPSEDFQVINLDILSFWPTMFGHVLSSPGNVDFHKVDCLGVIISHVTVDGKENPDFIEGKFGLAIRTINIIKENTE